MTDPTTEFFDELGRRGHEPLLHRVTATLRWDLVHQGKTARWFVTVDRGDIEVSRRNGPADVVVRADRAVFDRIASGEVNAVAAVLRGEMAIEGEWRILVSFQRLFPAAPAVREREAGGLAGTRS
jgi:putative sterol carrier protein